MTTKSKTMDYIKISDFIKNSEKNLSSISWVNQIEDELGNLFIEEQLTPSSSDSRTEESEEYNFDNITATNFDEESSDQLLTNLFFIVTELKKNIKKCLDIKNKNNEEKFLIDDFIEKLEYSKKISEYLSYKLKLPKIEHNSLDKKETIPRSSYKFCDFGKDCSYNYNHNRFSGCFAQHFVYNHLVADINALLKYLYNNKQKIKFVEISTCMNTICYVVNHMKDEYMGIKIYYPNKVNEKHNERTPVDKKRKKKLKLTNTKISINR